MMRVFLWFMLIFAPVVAHAQYLDGLPPATLPLAGSTIVAVCEGGTAGIPGTCQTAQTPIVNLPAGIVTGLPSVQNNAALKALITTGLTAGTAIYRSGFSMPGDGGAATYTWNGGSSNCSPADDGAQVQPTTGMGCWLIASKGPLNVAVWGAACNGSTNDTTPYAAALTYAGTIGATIVTCQAQGLVGNITVRAHASLIGNQPIAGGLQPNNAYTTAPSTILLTSGSTISMESNSSLSSLNVIRQNLPAAVTMRATIAAVNGFSGTGVMCSSQTDVVLRDLFITGFSLGIAAACDRLNVTNVRGDDTNGVSLTRCFDTCNFSTIEIYPFVSAVAGVPQFQTSNISSVTNSGGLYEIALTSVPATPIITGDVVVIAGVGGTTGANGRWNVTAIDTQHFTLTGSTFSGSYTSGGTAFLNATLRQGTAFDVEEAGGGPIIQALTTYGYNIGLHYGSGTSAAYCIGCWIDMYSSSPNFDPGVIGLLQDSGANNNYYTGFLNTIGQTVVINANGGLFISDSLIAALGWQSGVYSIAVNAGALNVTGGLIPTGGTPEATIYIADASGGLTLSNTEDPDASLVFQSSADCAKVTINGSVGPCIWAPTLIGSTGGTATQAGGYPEGSWVTNGSSVTLWGHIFTTSTATLTGVGVVGGLPFSAGTGGGSVDNGTCSFGRYGGITLSGGLTQLVGSVTAGQNQMQIDQLGSGVAAASVPVGQFANSSELQFTCSYHQ